MSAIKVTISFGIIVLALIYVVMSRAAFDTGYDDDDVSRDQNDFNKPRYVLQDDRQRPHQQSKSSSSSSSSSQRPNRTPQAKVATPISDATLAALPPPPPLQEEGNADQQKTQQPTDSPLSPAPAAVAAADPSSSGPVLESPCINDGEQQQQQPQHGILPPCMVRPDAHLPQNGIRDLIQNVLPRYSLLNLLRLYRNATAAQLLDPTHPAPCVLMLLHTTACHEFNESFTGCVKRLGIYNVEKILPGRCVDESFWRAFAKEYEEERREHPRRFPRPDPDPNLWKTLPRGEIPDSTTWTVSEKREYVPPEKRTFAQFAPATTCSSGAVINPFGFGIPIANIAKKLPLYKAFDFMPVTPPRHMGARGWSINIAAEQLFRSMYAASFVAFTNNRGGVDCMRHYEILASGTIPYFPDLPAVGKNRVTHLPRQMILETMEMAGLSHIGKIQNVGRFSDTPYLQRISHEHIHFLKPGVIQPTAAFNTKEYQKMAEKVHRFTLDHLSCGALVASMLRTMGYENPRRVLLISRFEYDYMHLTIHSGFNELGMNVTVVGEDSSSYFYRQRVDPAAGQSEKERGAQLFQRAKSLYGGGFAFAGRGYNRDEFVPSRSSGELIKRILAKEFDLAVYTYAYPDGHDRVPYIGELPSVLSRNQLAFVDHNDWSTQSKADMFAWQSKRGHVFSREMPDDPCR